MLAKYINSISALQLLFFPKHSHRTDIFFPVSASRTNLQTQEIAAKTMWIAMDHGRSFKCPVQGNPRTADPDYFLYIHIYIYILLYISCNCFHSSRRGKKQTDANDFRNVVSWFSRFSSRCLRHILGFPFRVCIFCFVFVKKSLFFRNFGCQHFC